MHFHRTELAEKMAKAITEPDMFSDVQNGLFLTAPRRTGKSMFLQHDLIPVLQEREVISIYVDLWSDRSSDPAILVKKAIAEQFVKIISKSDGKKKLLGIKGFSFMGFKLESGAPAEELTIPEALIILQKHHDKKIALIIDEAQQALSSSAGENLMFALKSARDQINSPSNTNLLLIMTGSDRDKLVRLVHGNSAPFFGSKIETLPVLDDGFIEFVAKSVERRISVPVNHESIAKAFELFNHRPQPFIDAIGDCLNPLKQTDDFEGCLLTSANAYHQGIENDISELFNGLTKLEQAILLNLLEQKERFKPYDNTSLSFYSDYCGKEVNMSKAQKAIEKMRNREPSLIWRSARGEYSVQETELTRWYESKTGLKSY